MTKSTSRSQVRLIASTNAIFGADEACAMLHISRDAMYRLAKDPDDPFPIRYIVSRSSERSAALGLSGGLSRKSATSLAAFAMRPSGPACAFPSLLT